jgi:hypothetical protein
MTNREQLKTFLPTLLLSVAWIAMAWGCAAKPIPLSEPTVAMLQRDYEQMRGLVASGQVSPIEARNQYYKKLSEVEPPLPELDKLQDYRRQIRDELMAGRLNLVEADSRLKARESELLSRWEETAAEYAAEQRRLEQVQREYERDYRQQRRIEEGSGIRNLPRQ